MMKKIKKNKTKRIHDVFQLARFLMLDIFIYRYYYCYAFKTALFSQEFSLGAKHIQTEFVLLLKNFYHTVFTPKFHGNLFFKYLSNVVKKGETFLSKV